MAIEQVIFVKAPKRKGVELEKEKVEEKHKHHKHEHKEKEKKEEKEKKAKDGKKRTREVVPVGTTKPGRMLRIVHMSDTHRKHQQLKFPDTMDIFVHSGDFTNKEEWKGLAEGAMPVTVANFNEWLGKIPLPSSHKIVIGGNHEIGFNGLDRQQIRALLSNGTYLQDEAYCLEGIKFYGTPWTSSRHMGFSASHEEMAKRWAAIPDDTEILVSHMPPRGIKDNAYDRGGKRPWGSESLLERVKALRPRVHLFGHVHDDVGPHEEDGILFVNAAADEFRNTYVIDYEQ